MNAAIAAEFTEITDRWFVDELDRGHQIVTSLEGENPGGSIKDHMVKNELRHWINAGKIHPGDRVSELSAGSTAVSLVHYCAEYALLPVVFLTEMAPEGLANRLTEQGVEIRVVPAANAYHEYAQACEREGFHRFNQLFDASKRRHYNDLGARIRRSLPKIDVVIGSVGTGHSLLGIGEGIGGHVRIVSAEPEPPLKAVGCRNVVYERHGPNDSCRAEDFHERALVGQTAPVFPDTKISARHGTLQITGSFQIVLGAVKRILSGRKGLTVFAVGAANRRMNIGCNPIAS